MSPVRGSDRPGGDQAFEPDEVRSAEALLSGTGAGAEGGIVVPWPILFRHRVHRRLSRSDRYQWWVLWTVLAGLLSVNITFTVFVVALPQVAHQLHTSVSTLTWTSTGPLLAFGVAAPVLGKLGDLRGYRRLYLWGLSGAAVSVVLTASAPTAGVLIAARLFDGVQGAATGAASMALVLQAFSHEDRVKAMGWWALVGAGGPVLGVTIGAPIIQYFGWRALFWGELPLMAVAAVLAVVVLPARDRPEEPSDRADGADGAGAGPEGDEPAPRAPASPWRQLDWTGSWTLALSVTAGLLALNEAPSWGFTAPATLAVFAVCLAAGAFFVAHERRAPRPLIPLRYFRMRNFVFPLGRPDLRQLLLHGRVLPLPHPDGGGLRLQRDPGRAGVHGPPAAVLPRGAGGRLRRRQGGGAAAWSWLGLWPSPCPCCMFTQLGADPSLVVILVALALSGVGNGLSTPSTVSSASNEVAPDELGVMSAAQQLITQIGIVAGIQVMVTVQASAHGGVGSLASFHRAYAVGAIGAVLAGVCGFFMRNTPRGGPHRPGAGPPGGLSRDRPTVGRGRTDRPISW